MGVTLTQQAADDKYAFLKLGIMLLEIFAGESFPSSQSPAAGDHRMTDLVTVNNWVEQEEGNMTKAFYNAISECISWFAHPGAYLRNDGFQARNYQSTHHSSEERFMSERRELRDLDLELWLVVVVSLSKHVLLCILRSCRLSNLVFHI